MYLNLLLGLVINSYELRHAYQRMSTAVPGSYATMASQLGISESSLDARIYERKGQTLSVRHALLMQDISERTDFAETVAKVSGGVFVRLPSVNLSDKDIQNNFLNLGGKFGEFITAWRQAIADGALSAHERRQLDAIAQELYAFASAIVLLTNQYYAHGNAGESESC